MRACAAPATNAPPWRVSWIQSSNSRESLGDRAGIVAELFAFLWAKRLYWLVPMVAILLVLGLLTVVATVVPGGAFIYTLF